MNENITHNSKQYGFLQQLALHSKYKKPLQKSLLEVLVQQTIQQNLTRDLGKTD